MVVILQHAMPWIINTYKGKEKRLVAILKENFGINARVPPIREYVISEKEPPLSFRQLSGVLGVIEATDDEAWRLLNEDTSGKPILQVGSLVVVKEEPFSGLSGIVRGLDNGQARIDVMVWGKPVSAVVAVENLAIEELPKQWR